MATEVTVPMDDKELFSAAMADEAPVVEATPEPAPAEAEPEQPRDEHGRFAPKTEPAPQADAAPTQQPAETVTEPKDEGGNVPSWRLREIREERDALARRAQEIEQQATTYQQQMAAMQRQLAELRAPKQSPEELNNSFYVDPTGAVRQQLTPYEERIAKLEGDLRMSTSRAMAVARHGWDAVAEVEKAVAEAMRTNDPQLQPLVAQLQVTDDPVGAAMQWHSSTRLLKETGGNINAYRDKILADAMKDPAFQAKVIEAARGQAGQANPGSPNIKLPPSLNKTAGSGVTAADLSSDDMSDRALFKHAVGSR